MQLALRFGADELSDVDVRVDLVPRFQTRDLGIDVVGASVACEGDAMVAVLDEVRAPTSKTWIAGMTPSGNALRRFARESSLGSEVAAEVGAAVDGPDDAVDRDLLQGQ